MRPYDWGNLLLPNQGLYLAHVKIGTKPGEGSLDPIHRKQELRAIA